MTGAVWQLTVHSLRRARGLIAGTGLVFGGFQILASLAASTFDESQLFARLAALVPEGVRQVMGASFLTVMSFAGMATLGYVHFAVTGTLVGLAIAIGTEPAAEIERGFSDLVMARPLARAVPVTRSVLVLLITATVSNGLMLAGTYLGLAIFAPAGAPWPTPRLLLSLALSLWMLMMCWGGVALALGASARRRGVAGAAAGFLAVTLYLLDLVSRVWPPGRWLAPLSPFHYFNPLDLVAGQPLDPGHLAVLAATGAAGIGLGYLAYARRDL